MNAFNAAEYALNLGAQAKAASALMAKAQTATKNAALGKLAELLRAEGCRVVMTREDDTFIPLGERTRIANQYSNALFIAVHFNSGGTGNGTVTVSACYSGAEVEISVADNGPGIPAGDRERVLQYATVPLPDGNMLLMHRVKDMVLVQRGCRIDGHAVEYVEQDITLLAIIGATQHEFVWQPALQLSLAPRKVLRAAMHLRRSFDQAQQPL